jgi:dihydrofolate synthase/folylpolyglutamate synthase
LGYDISEEDIAQGVAATRWFGRFTIVDRDPITIIDGGHNRQGAQVLRDSIEAYFPGRKVVFVLGLLADKEIDEILSRILPVADRIYTVAVPSARTMAPEELAEAIRARGVEARAVTDVREVRGLVAPEEILCFAGSLYSIADYGYSSEF